MNEGQICSLCVSVITNKGIPMLFRVADIFENKLTPYELDPNREYDEYNRDLIRCHPSSIPEEGAVSIWEWDSWRDLIYNNYKQKLYPKPEVRWIEYVQFNDVSALIELKKRLFSGIDGIESDHDYLFEFEQPNDAERTCVYCEARHFNISVDKKATLKGSMHYFEIYTIKVADIGEIKTWRIPKLLKRYYKSLVLGENDRKELINTPEAVIKQIILSRIRKYSPEMKDKNARKNVRDFLDFIPSSTLIEDISWECNCDLQVAQMYLDAFLKNCEVYYNSEDFGAEILTRLIANNAQIAEKFKALVYESWLAENDALIKKAESELCQLNAQIDEAKKGLYGCNEECSQLRQTALELKNKIEALRQEHEWQVQTAGDIFERVRQKLSAAKEDITDFFAEYSVFTGFTDQSKYLPPQFLTNSTIEIICGETITDAPYQARDISDLADCLAENLEAAGVVEMYRPALAAYLIAAYILHIPLILSGYGAEPIADALSATLNNKVADRVYCFDKADISPLVQCSKDEVVAIYDAFHSGVMSRLFSSRSSPYMCFIALMSEELAIEPRGLYDYALPLFTEFFINAPQTGVLSGSLCGLDLNMQVSSQRGIALPTHVISRFSFSQCKKLLGCADYIGKGVTDFEGFLLQTMPIMLALGRRDELLELITSVKLSEKEKKDLLILLGEPQ